MQEAPLQRHISGGVFTQMFGKWTHRTLRILLLSICVTSAAVGVIAQSVHCIDHISFPQARFSGGGQRLAEAANAYCREFEENQQLKAIYGFSIDLKHAQIVRIFENRATYTWYEDSARFRELELSETEIAEFKSEISKIDHESLGPMINHCVDMCSAYQYVSIKMGRGKRIPIVSGSFSPPKPLASIAELFRKWNAYSKMRTRYYLQETIPLAQLLVSDQKYDVRSVWESDSDLIVLVRELGLPPSQAIAWRSFASGRVGARVDQPQNIYFLNLRENACGLSMEVNNYPFERSLNGELLCVGVHEKAGLWLVGSDKQTKLVRGEYSSPILTRNQKWIVSSKGDVDKPIWKSTVRINTKTKKEYKVDIPRADCMYPSSTLPDLDEVLIVRCKAEYTPKENNPSPDPPEYYLLDPQTGGVRRTTGEIRPIMHQRYRYLQPSSSDERFWAAIPENGSDSTEVGLYDTKNVSFEPVVAIPSIRFYSGDLFVDEKNGFFYIAYKSQLLRIPFNR